MSELKYEKEKKNTTVNLAPTLLLCSEDDNIYLYRMYIVEVFLGCWGDEG